MIAIADFATKIFLLASTCRMIFRIGKGTSLTMPLPIEEITSLLHIHSFESGASKNPMARFFAAETEVLSTGIGEQRSGLWANILVLGFIFGSRRLIAGA